MYKETSFIISHRKFSKRPWYQPRLQLCPPTYVLVAATDFVAIYVSCESETNRKLLTKGYIRDQSTELGMAIPKNTFLHSTPRCRETTKNMESKTNDFETEVYLSDEGKPTFRGGEDALGKFIQDNVKYPTEALKNNITGSVYVNCVIEKDGRIEEIETFSCDDSLFEDEALRLFRNMPHWKPGVLKGDKVKAGCIIKLIFDRGIVGHEVIDLPFSKEIRLELSRLINRRFDKKLGPLLQNSHTFNEKGIETRGKGVLEKSYDSALKSQRLRYIAAGQWPSYPGGEEAFAIFIEENSQHYQELNAKEARGKTYVAFTVEKDGEVTEVEVVIGANEKLDSRAKALAEGMPNWIQPDSTLVDRTGMVLMFDFDGASIDYQLVNIMLDLEVWDAVMKRDLRKLEEKTTIKTQ